MSLILIRFSNIALRVAVCHAFDSQHDNLSDTSIDLASEWDQKVFWQITITSVNRPTDSVLLPLHQLQKYVVVQFFCKGR